MTADRAYRGALSVEDALEELERGAGSQFDAALVAVTIRLVRGGRLPLEDAAGLAC